MYPHIIIGFNIERNTMIGKLIIPDVTEDVYPHTFFVDDKAKEKEESRYDAGKDFMDNYLVDDTLSMGSKWFNLPDVMEVDKLFNERVLNNRKKKTHIIGENPYLLSKLKIEI